MPQLFTHKNNQLKNFTKISILLTCIFSIFACGKSNVDFCKEYISSLAKVYDDCNLDFTKTNTETCTDSWNNQKDSCEEYFACRIKATTCVNNKINSDLDSCPNSCIESSS